MENERDQQLEDFYQLYILLCKDFSRFKSALPKTNLNPSQVKILLGFHAYLKNQKELCFSRLKAAKHDDPFFEGVRNCFLGIAHNYFGNYNFALEHLTKGRELLVDCSNEYFKDLNITTLFLVHVNRNQVEPLHQLIDVINDVKPGTDFLRLSLVMCKSLYLQMIGDFKKSNKLIDLEFAKRSERFGAFEVNFVIIRFVNFFKSQDYLRCEKELETYKKASGFTAGSNYRFMRILFDHILRDKPLYVYKSDFKDSAELFDQLMVIKCLAESDIPKASEFWSRLAKQNPETYHANFVFQGNACLFGTALKKQIINKSEGDINISTLNSIKSINDKLDYIFEHGPESIKKAQLIMLLWNEEASEKNRARLRKAIFDFHFKRGKSFESYQEIYKKTKTA